MLVVACAAALVGPASAEPTPAFNAQRVNPDAAGDQFTSSAGMASDGHFAVAYSSSASGHSDVFIRRYDANEVAAAPTADGVDVSATDRDQPSLGMNAAGAMVVAYRYDGSGVQDIRAQRLAADGTAVGSEISVNAATTGQQINPKIAVAPDGRFVVVWQTFDGTAQIQARAFSAAGVPTTVGDIAVSASYGSNPTVDIDSAGKFVVAWHEDPQPMVPGVVKARRFDATGTAQGAEFAAFSGANNTSYTHPGVGLADDGRMAVVFGGLAGVSGQRVDAANAAQGGPFTVSTTTAAGLASMEMDPNGDFIAAYATQQGGGSQAVVRQYTAAGVAQGAEVIVGTDGSQAQGNAYPSVATDGSARMAVAWTGVDGGGNSFLGSFTRRLNYGTVPPSPPGPSPPPSPAPAPTAPATTSASAPPQCSDGRDNDGDGAIDLKDPGCATPQDNNEADESVGDLVLCGRRQISLVRADAKGAKVILAGLVARNLAGKPVQIFANYGSPKHRGRLTRFATVKSDARGQFTARVKRPPRRLFDTARLQARVGRSRSVALKLPQSLASTSVRKAGGRIELRGTVKRSLLGKRNVIVVKRLECGHYQTVGTAKPGATGSYVVRFAAPRLGDAALYRAQSQVLVRPRGKRYVTQFARAIGITLTGRSR